MGYYFRNKQKRCNCKSMSRSLGGGLVFFRRVIFAVLLSVFLVNNLSNKVNAYTEYEWIEGSYTDGVVANCNWPNNAFTGLCDAGKGAGSGGGGASWRIFSVKQNAPGLDDSTSYGGNILAESLKDDILDACKEIGADWLFSFGWDGMYGSAYGYSKFNFQIGPAKRAGVIAGAAYNNYGKKKVTIKKKKANGEVYYIMNESKFANNTKISKGAALVAYQTYVNPKASVIPPSVGAFCGKEAESDNFEGKAYVSEGAWKTASNKADTGWKKGDKTASISMNGPNAGVRTRYLIRMRSKGGSGTTKYKIVSTTGTMTDANDKNYRKKTALTGTVLLDGSTSGDHILKGLKGKNGSWGDVDPGEKHCKYMYFLTDGEDGSDIKRVGACATVNETYFVGKSSVSGGMSGDTKWGNGLEEENGAENPKNVSANCSTDGCSVTFNHYIKKTSGTKKNIGSSGRYVARVSNATSDNLGNKKIANNGKFNAGTFDGSAYAGETAQTVSSLAVTMYPGVKVCEALYFNYTNHYSYKSVVKNRQVCAFATGNAQPGDSNAHVFLDIKAKNNDVTKYNDYQQMVYAKPGDKVQFRVNYDPVLQYSYHLVPDVLKIDGVWKSENANKAILGNLFNSVKGSGYDNWNNGYGVKGEKYDSNGAKTGDFGDFDRSVKYDAGDSRSQSDEGDSYEISNTHVGLELREKAKTNQNIPGKISNTTTPSQVTFSRDNGKMVANVITTPVEKATSVKVPYNFTTAIDVELEGARTVKVDGKEKPAFASGENGNVKIHVDLLKKHNDLTTNDANEKYATKSDDAKLKLILFVPGGSTYPEDTTDYGTLNSALCNRYSGSSVCSETFVEKSDNAGKVASRVLQSVGLNGGSTDENSGFTVPDLDAGTQVCVAAAVYPSTSGSDANLNPKGDDKWNISKAKCFAVYKKPSLQVWGGNVFSAGKIDTPVAVKKHIFKNNGYDDYNILSKGAGRIFGSFGEISVISLGSVSGFSSGAATGYAGYNERDHVMIPRQSFPANMLNVLINQKLPIESFGGYVGGSDSDFCERSRLTFANTGCNNGGTTGLGGSGQSSASANRSSLIATFVNMNDEERARKNVTVETPGGDYTISGEVLLAKGNGEEETPGETKVIYAQKGDVTIDTNILYDDSGYYKLSDVPKLVIYAKNIWINCGVTRIDAVLIAENTVDTCADLDGDSMSRKSSNQLVINGTIITDKLEARRTYGAAAGGNSIVPAEIVNYDTTLYLWGSNQADVTETGKLDVTYSREIAPKR